MKTNKKFGKSVAVVFIMGLAILYNMDIKYSRIYDDTIISEKIEKLNINMEKVQEKKSELALYVKSIFVTGIKQIISNH
jgi:hypothetical protein